MKSNFVKNGLVAGIIILFLGVVVTPLIECTEIEHSNLPISNGNTFYVGGSGPDNYTSIQDAIDDASSGDTVFVYNGTYFENIELEKSIKLIGEDTYTTIIDGSNGENVVYIYAGFVNIRGFTIRNGGFGIYLHYSNNIQILNNSISSNGKGIEFWASNNNFISGNEFSNNQIGIYLFDSNNNKMFSNKISYSFWYGIYHLACNNNEIKNNVFRLNGRDGIFMLNSNNNSILNNTLDSNGYGISLDDSNDNHVQSNNFSNNGLFVWAPCKNIVDNNNVNNKPLLYLEDESDIVIDYDVGQVILVSCRDIIVKNQEISNTTIGIELCDTKKCSIKDNNLFNNIFGIVLWDAQRNIISDNNIESSKDFGIWMYKSNFNNIFKNNFIDNKENTDFIDSIINRWRRNYWNEPRNVPYIIFGRMGFFMPWINIDWFPAKAPYNTEVSI